MAPRFRRPSPAFVLALVALFVALGGSAIAAGVAPIPKRALFANKAGVANNSLKLQGKTTAQILALVPAPPAPPPLTSVASFASIVPVNYTLNAGAEQSVTATCPAGSKAMGGGFSNPTPAPVFSFGSFPTADGAGWTEDLANGSSQGTAASGQVFVTCIK